MFERHIRNYFAERSGIYFHCTEFGFIGWSIRVVPGEKHIYINEFYVESGTHYSKTLRMVRDVVALGKEFGCTHLIGCNQINTDEYDDIKKLHKWFGMEPIAYDGNTEFWAREI